MQLDFWRSKEGYTIGLEESSELDLSSDSWAELIQEAIDAFNESKKLEQETIELEIGDHSIEVEVDSLPKLIGVMIDLGNEEIPEDYSDEDSIYRCLMLDLPEGEEDE